MDARKFVFSTNLQGFSKMLPKNIIYLCQKYWAGGFMHRYIDINIYVCVCVYTNVIVVMKT